MNSKEKIINQAAQLIHTKGYNHTSVQDILDAASVTKSNFYYHFESKERLAFEMLARQMRLFYEMAIGPSVDNPELNPLERIETFLDTLQGLGCSEAGERGCPFGNLAQEVSTTHEPLRQALSVFFHACRDLLEQCFEEGKAGGVFREALPSRALAEFVLAQIQGAFLLRKTHKDGRSFHGNIEMLRQVIHTWSGQGQQR